MQCPEGSTLTDLGCIPEDPLSFAQKFYNIGLGLIGIVSFFFILYGAFLIATSKGDPQKLTNGKTYVYYAVAGIIFILLIFLIIKIVAINTLSIPEFK